jgi:hypothetical protein
VRRPSRRGRQLPHRRRLHVAIALVADQERGGGAWSLPLRSHRRHARIARTRWGMFRWKSPASAISRPLGLRRAIAASMSCAA